MDLSVVTTERECVLTASGNLGAADVHEIRRRAVELLETHVKDVVLDMRQVSRVDAGLFTGLLLVRSRAKGLRRHLVVVDMTEGVYGVTGRGLRQRGLHMRIPIYGDCDEATAALAFIRAARSKAAGTSS